jgi:iron complex transport system ATP-binding protein
LGNTRISKHKAKFSQHNSTDIPLQVKDVVMMGRYPYFDGQPRKEDWDAMSKCCWKPILFILKTEIIILYPEAKNKEVHLSRVMAQLENDVAHKLLFLDEPLNNLDIKYQYRALESMKNFTRKPIR